VLVHDKAAYPREIQSAGRITPALIDELSLDVDEYRSSRTFQVITGFKTGVVGRPTLETKYGGPVSYGIRRTEFDHYLLQRSRAQLALTSPLSSLTRANGTWTVNGEHHAPVIVGAGGHFCPVARTLPERRQRTPVVATQEVEFRMTPAQAETCDVSREVPELYFLPELDGYAWCFRKGDYLNIGLGRIGAKDVPDRVKGFLDFLISERRVPGEAVTRWRGHAYRLYGTSARPVVGDGVVLVGDSAGLAYPQSGEGIRTAVESGLLAAAVLIKAGGQVTVDALQPYAASLEARFGKPSVGASPAADTWFGRWTASAGRALMSTRWFTRRIVLDRWFLHRRQGVLELS
jgi:flavin-dependent dehydrogenase